MKYLLYINNCSDIVFISLRLICKKVLYKAVPIKGMLITVNEIFVVVRNINPTSDYDQLRIIGLEYEKELCKNIFVCFFSECSVCYLRALWN